MPENSIPILYRQYSLCNELDFWNVQQGLCPDYALLWDDELNQKYWPEHYDYIGNRPHEHSSLKVEYTISLRMDDTTQSLKNHVPVSSKREKTKNKKVDFAIFREILPFEQDEDNFLQEDEN